MTFSGHLRELKKALFPSLLLFMAIFVLAWMKGETVLGWVQDLAKVYDYQLVYLSPQEVLLQEMRLAGLAAFVCALPVFIWGVCGFVSPVFEQKKSFMKMVSFILVGIGMFVLGVAFALKILLPFMLKYMYQIGTASGIKGMVSLQEFISLYISMTVWLGIIFETPIVCRLLTGFGILTAADLKKARPAVIVVCFIVSAVITPPDIFSQCMVAIPMCLLYQVGIWVSMIGVKKIVDTEPTPA